MALSVKPVFFRIFPYCKSKNDGVIKKMAPFLIFFMKQKILLC